MRSTGTRVDGEDASHAQICRKPIAVKPLSSSDASDLGIGRAIDRPNNIVRYAASITIKSSAIRRPVSSPIPGNGALNGLPHGSIATAAWPQKSSAPSNPQPRYSMPPQPCSSSVAWLVTHETQDRLKRSRHSSGRLEVVLVHALQAMQLREEVQYNPKKIARRKILQTDLL